MTGEMTKKEYKTVLFVAIARMGDLLQASATIQGFKNEHPDTHLVVLTDKTFSDVCRGVCGVDEIYEVDLSIVVRALRRDGAGIVDSYEYVLKIERELKARNFDLVLNISSSSYSALLIRMLKVEDCRGWVSDDEGFRLIESPWSRLFTAAVYHSNRDFNGINLVDTLRCVAGVTKHPEKLVYNIAEEAHQEAEQLLGSLGLAGKSQATGPLIALHAGASQDKRQWSPAYFARLVRLLVEGQEARVLFTGSAGEMTIVESICKEICAQSRSPQEAHEILSHIGNILGRTKHGVLGGVLKRCDLLISGDTGPMHMAVAMGTPVVAMFLASALGYETGPYSAGNIIVQPQISCNPCNPNYPCSRPDCHDEVTPELVAYLAKQRILLMGGEVSKGDILAGDVSDWVIPEALAPADSVAVYWSYFDDHRFLALRRLNSFGSRHGMPDELYDWARRAYRGLWKEEFGICKNSLAGTVDGGIVVGESMSRQGSCNIKGSLSAGVLSGLSTSRATGASTGAVTGEFSGECPGEFSGGALSGQLLKYAEQGVSEIVECAENGVKLLNALDQLIYDVSAEPKLLGEINRKLMENEKRMEHLGLVYPLYGLITRIFIIEKENMRGNDPLVLSSEMKELYESVKRRMERFGELFRVNQYDSYYSRRETNGRGFKSDSQCHGFSGAGQSLN